MIREVGNKTMRKKAAMTTFLAVKNISLQKYIPKITKNKTKKTIIFFNYTNFYLQIASEFRNFFSQYCVLFFNRFIFILKEISKQELYGNASNHISSDHEFTHYWLYTLQRK